MLASFYCSANNLRRCAQLIHPIYHCIFKVGNGHAKSLCLCHLGSILDIILQLPLTQIWPGSMPIGTYPLWTRYSLQHLKKSLNVILEKSPGNCDVAKLQIIHLFKGDFKYNNKGLLGHTSIKQAEMHELLVHKQYGSRKAKAAITQCLNKCLWYDHVHFQQEPAALCSNDAKSCYDCIVLLAAALWLCHWGASIPVVTSMITTFEGMTHHIWTAFGDSSQGEGRKQWSHPVMGIGQGNRAGPQIWAAICTPLFDIMQLDSFITNICCAMSGQDLQLAGFAFMDDTYFCIAGQSSVGATIVDLMQQSVTQWEGLLTATGGALVPEKCFWYLLEFKQSNRQWKYSAKTCMQASIQIRDTNNQSWTINRLEPHEARWTLGVCLAPDGNCQAKLEYLKSIA